MNAADYYGLDELKCACSGFIQVKPLLIFYSIQAWEPSPAKVLKVIPAARLPVLERFYRETKFSPLTSSHSIKNLKTKLRTFWWVPRVPQLKFLSYDRTKLHFGFNTYKWQTY